MCVYRGKLSLVITMVIDWIYMVSVTLLMVFNY
jgi:hypothetical protein